MQPPHLGPNIEEWKNLYSEIQNNSNKISSALALIFGGTTGILGLTVTDPGSIGGLPCLLAFLLIIPGARFIHSQLDSTAQNAAYIKVFHEGPDTQIFWETRLQAIKKVDGKYASSISWMILGMGVITLMTAVFMSFSFLVGAGVAGSTYYLSVTEEAGILYSWDLVATLVLGTLALGFLELAVVKIKQARKKYPSHYEAEFRKLIAQNSAPANAILEGDAGGDG